LVKNILKAAHQLNMRVTFLAHNTLDVEAIKYIQDNAFDSDRCEIKLVGPSALLNELANAKALITWRVHGAMAAKSLGLPVLLFKTDSRYLTAEQIGVNVIDNSLSRMSDVNRFLHEVATGSQNDHFEDIQQTKDRAFQMLQERWNDIIGAF
jgi:hypothetical protein